MPAGARVLLAGCLVFTPGRLLLLAILTFLAYRLLSFVADAVLGEEAPA